MKIKNIVYIVIVLGVIIIGGGLLFSNNFWQTNVKKTDDVQEVKGKEVILVIDSGETDSKILTSEFNEGMTAFDLLKKEAEKLSLTIETKNYDVGIFIQAIGDKKNGQDEKYWLYYVNGQMSNLSADKMIIKAGDKVEFKFEKSPF
jgi:hypothetical protein